MKLFQPTKPIINGNHLANNEAIKQIQHIDNEQTLQFENNFKFPKLAILFWLIALAVLVGGLYLASRI